MGDVNAWAGAIGGTILCLELIVLLVILVAINVGLFFGLRWVLSRQEWLHEKNLWALGLLTKYVDRGMGLVAAPVIVTTSIWRGLKAGLYRAVHWPPASAVQREVPAASPSAPPSAAKPDVVSGPSRAA